MIRGTRVFAACVVACAFFSLFAVASASAAQVNLCVPTTAGQPITSNGSGTTCTSGTAVALPSSSTDQQTLISMLPYIKFNASGVGGKPTITLSGGRVGRSGVTSA